MELGFTLVSGSHINIMIWLEKNLERATKLAEQTGGGVLVISEGVFGMRGGKEN